MNAPKALAMLRQIQRECDGAMDTRGVQIRALAGILVAVIEDQTRMHDDG